MPEKKFVIISFLSSMPMQAMPNRLPWWPLNVGRGRIWSCVIVVDEDIDPSDSYDVLWAMATRTDPEKDIDVVRQAWGSKVDP